MAFTTAFTDAQGTEFTEAYFEVAGASLSRSINENVNRTPPDGGLESRTEKGSQLSYQMYYWVSEQHKLEGKLPYKLANESGVNFYFSDLGPEYDNLDAVQCADLHCQTVILPNMV